MDSFKILFLSLIQALTEFFPISSSGHLVVFGDILKPHVSSPFFFYIFLHAGTLLSVLIYFRKKIISLIFLRDIDLLLNLIVGSFSTLPVALLLDSTVKSMINEPYYVGIAWILNGAILLSLIPRRREGNRKVELSKAIIIGFFQGIGVIPGISRSGITIVSALHLGVSREEAFEFSFLLFIPAVIGSIVFEGGSLKGGIEYPLYALGFFTSFAGSFLFLWILKRFVVKGWFPYFGFYSLLMGSVVLFM